MEQPWYVGSGQYCYANSTAMLLASIGEDISPATIEVLTGVGLSASAKRDGGPIFFNHQPLPPDLGIQKALELLGFECQVHVSESASDYPAKALHDALKTSPAVIGPVDGGYLPYNPHHRVSHFDHFLYAYETVGQVISIHDPAGYPHVFSSYADLQEAWKAEAIDYRQGYYRFLSHPRRVKTPDARELYLAAAAHFAALYRKCGEAETRQAYAVGKEAIDLLADRIQAGALEESEKGHLIFFALPLGARRANDFARVFQNQNQELCDLKMEQARLFGTARTHLVMGNSEACVQAVRRLGRVEDQIHAILSV